MKNVAKRWAVKIAFLGILGMFQVSIAQASVKSDYTKVKQTIDWIYSPKHKRRPTGNLARFNGKRLMFYFSRKKRINGADVSFGYTLYRTYDMYCLKKFKRKNCLGKKLNVSYNIKGSKKWGAKVMTVRVNGQSFSSNYFQEVIKNFYSRLEKIGGSSKLSAAENALVKPKQRLNARVRLFPVYPTNAKHANVKWMKGSYVGNVFKSLKSSLYNMVGFKVKSNRGIKSNKYYKDKRQYTLLKKYRHIGVPKYITSVISGPNTVDAAGLTYLQYTKKPMFVMRSRYNSGKAQYSSRALRNTALIFLHELAHNMRLTHCKRGQKSLCTDNLHTNKNRAAHMVKYLNKISALEASYAF